ncbi:M24 family metallopeptidase [Brevibacillus sp. B_LB10_24]|uniref:M24 family metallopeptidase n=1 Tax=Brevibacillus sp. B_LB10_24 TaxID=3380645 RepID=UPI0038B818BD
MRLQASFYQRKVKQLQAELQKRGLAGMLLLKPTNIYYLIGFFHIPTERPIGVFVPAAGEPIAYVPELEVDHIKENWINRVEVYFDYPGETYPVLWICQKLQNEGISRQPLGFEGSIPWAYKQMIDQALPDVNWVPAGDILSDMRLVKEKEELELLRLCGTYSDYMVSAGVEVIRERGWISELEIHQTVMQRVVQKMLAELDEIVFTSGVAMGLVCSGERSALPHGLPSSRRLQPGDNLILSFVCSVGGYTTESERTFFLGEPSTRQASLYELMRKAQQVGCEALSVGRTCSEANRLALAVIREAGEGAYIKHRLGHGLGIEGHEPPWLMDGDNSPLRPGMVLSSEPGIYVPGLGGVRISDTVVVTDGEPEYLTTYSRSLEDMVVNI